MWQCLEIKKKLTAPNTVWASQVMLVIKNLLAKAGDKARDTGLIPGSGRSPGGGHGNALQYSCLENPVVRGAWWATVHGLAKSRHDWSDLPCMYVTLYIFPFCFMLFVFPLCFNDDWWYLHNYIYFRKPRLCVTRNVGRYFVSKG